VATAPVLLGTRPGERGGTSGLRHGFETLELDGIVSIFTPDNVASGRVMEALGMHDCLATTDAAGVGLSVREITRLERQEATSRAGPEGVPEQQ